jgi:hypothetical protein
MGREMIESLGCEKYYKKYKPLRILGWNTQPQNMVRLLKFKYSEF